MDRIVVSKAPARRSNRFQARRSSRGWSSLRTYELAPTTTERSNAGDTACMWLCAQTTRSASLPQSGCDVPTWLASVEGTERFRSSRTLRSGSPLPLTKTT